MKKFFVLLIIKIKTSLMQKKILNKNNESDLKKNLSKSITTKNPIYI